MTSDAAHRLRELMRKAPPQFLAVVDSVQADGTLNLQWGGAVIPGVPASSGYPVEVRKSGQTVAVLNFEGPWLVIGSTGTSEALPQADLSPYATGADLTEAITDLAGDIPRETDVTWGTGPPAGDWVQADTVWMRTTTSRVYLYGQRAASAPPPTPKPPKPPKPPVTPSPVTTTPTATGAWRDGKRDSGQPPRQSKYSSSFGPYTGAWFYGNLRGHTSGKSVRAMTITLTRSKTSNGIGGGARVRLYLTSASSPKGSPPSRHTAWSPGTLARGERKTFTLPASYRTALANGTARGIVCYSSAKSESIIFSTAAPIRITYNAS